MRRVSICVLTFGNYPQLARQVIGSICQKWPRHQYTLIVGANSVCDETASFLQECERKGEIDCLVESQQNLNKCPMMHQLFEHVETEYVWWFDDDSYIVDPGSFNRWLTVAEKAAKDTVMWGQIAWCDSPLGFAPELEDPIGFVRSAPWYRGLPPPSWKPGGKGEFNFRGQGTGDGTWRFLVGGCWLVRMSAIVALDWPDRRLLHGGDDAFLGEALRQNGWSVANIENPGVAINTEERRAIPGAPNFRLDVVEAKRMSRRTKSSSGATEE